LKPIAKPPEGVPIKRHFLENPDKVFGAGMTGTLVPAFGGRKAFTPAPLPNPDLEHHAATETIA
jgi:hypothetical protein